MNFTGKMRTLFSKNLNFYREKIFSLRVYSHPQNQEGAHILPKVFQKPWKV